MPVKFVKATCPACGATLEVADNLASATCAYCGAKIILAWEGEGKARALLRERGIELKRRVEELAEEQRERAQEAIAKAKEEAARRREELEAQLKKEAEA